ncbi:NUDIX hydrolase [Actinomadura sp. WMMB 499]|uniref:NUDIX hydrolase n=1 Tax=Actinomadura sp. WMMB 499 TaxID=1219491 RepID=UPI001C3FA33C|nr:NUDIX hydrolase [Actinomadura sp. WMMB 499]
MTAAEPSAAYERLRRDHPDLFADPPDAPVRILPSVPATGGPYGVCYRDPYITVVRDPVEFPGGGVGGHVRVLPTSLRGGAAVLPVCGDRIVLVRHFRHSTRQWHWEIPRGFAEPGESPERTARRELHEEIGVTALDLTSLGRLHTDTGISGGAVELFWARVDPPTRVDADEGIESVALLDPRELDVLQDRGDLTDSFTLAALLHVQRRSLPPFSRS